MRVVFHILILHLLMMPMSWAQETGGVEKSESQRAKEVFEEDQKSDQESSTSIHHNQPTQQQQNTRLIWTNDHRIQNEHLDPLDHIFQPWSSFDVSGYSGTGKNHSVLQGDVSRFTHEQYYDRFLRWNELIGRLIKNDLNPTMDPLDQQITKMQLDQLFRSANGEGYTHSNHNLFTEDTQRLVRQRVMFTYLNAPIELGLCETFTDQLKPSVEMVQKLEASIEISLQMRIMLDDHIKSLSKLEQTADVVSKKEADNNQTIKLLESSLNQQLSQVIPSNLRPIPESHGADSKTVFQAQEYLSQIVKTGLILEASGIAFLQADNLVLKEKILTYTAQKILELDGLFPGIVIKPSLAYTKVKILPLMGIFPTHRKAIARLYQSLHVQGTAQALKQLDYRMVDDALKSVGLLDGWFKRMEKTKLITTSMGVLSKWLIFQSYHQSDLEEAKWIDDLTFAKLLINPESKFTKLPSNLQWSVLPQIVDIESAMEVFELTRNCISCVELTSAIQNLKSQLNHNFSSVKLAKYFPYLAENPQEIFWSNVPIHGDLFLSLESSAGTSAQNKNITQPSQPTQNLYTSPPQRYQHSKEKIRSSVIQPGQRYDTTDPNHLSHVQHDIGVIAETAWIMQETGIDFIKATTLSEKEAALETLAKRILQYEEIFSDNASKPSLAQAKVALLPYIGILPANRKAVVWAYKALGANGILAGMEQLDFRLLDRALRGSAVLDSWPLNIVKIHALNTALTFLPKWMILQQYQNTGTIESQWVNLLAYQRMLIQPRYHHQAIPKSIQWDVQPTLQTMDDAKSLLTSIESCTSCIYPLRVINDVQLGGSDDLLDRTFYRTYFPDLQKEPSLILLSNIDDSVPPFKKEKKVEEKQQVSQKQENPVKPKNLGQRLVSWVKKQISGSDKKVNSDTPEMASLEPTIKELSHLDWLQRLEAWNKLTLDHAQNQSLEQINYEQMLVNIFPEFSNEERIALRKKYIQTQITFSLEDASGLATQFMNDFRISVNSPAVSDQKEVLAIVSNIERTHAEMNNFGNARSIGPISLGLKIAEWMSNTRMSAWFFDHILDISKPKFLPNIEKSEQIPVSRKTVNPKATSNPPRMSNANDETVTIQTEQQNITQKNKYASHKDFFADIATNGVAHIENHWQKAMVHAYINEYTSHYEKISIYDNIETAFKTSLGEAKNEMLHIQWLSNDGNTYHMRQMHHFERYFSTSIDGCCRTNKNMVEETDPRFEYFVFVDENKKIHGKITLVHGFTDFNEQQPAMFLYRIQNIQPHIIEETLGVLKQYASTQGKEFVISSMGPMEDVFISDEFGVQDKYLEIERNQWNEDFSNIRYFTLGFSPKNSALAWSEHTALLYEPSHQAPNATITSYSLSPVKLEFNYKNYLNELLLVYENHKTVIPYLNLSRILSVYDIQYEFNPSMLELFYQEYLANNQLYRAQLLRSLYSHPLAVEYLPAFSKQLLEIHEKQASLPKMKGNKNAAQYSNDQKLRNQKHYEAFIDFIYISQILMLVEKNANEFAVVETQFRKYLTPFTRMLFEKDLSNTAKLSNIIQRQKEKETILYKISKEGELIDSEKHAETKEQSQKNDQSISKEITTTAHQEVDPLMENSILGLKDFVKSDPEMLRIQNEAYFRKMTPEQRKGISYIWMDNQLIIDFDFKSIIDHQAMLAQAKSFFSFYESNNYKLKPIEVLEYQKYKNKLKELFHEAGIFFSKEMQEQLWITFYFAHQQGNQHPVTKNLLLNQLSKYWSQQLKLKDLMDARVVEIVRGMEKINIFAGPYKPEPILPKYISKNTRMANYGENAKNLAQNAFSGEGLTAEQKLSRALAILRKTPATKMQAHQRQFIESLIAKEGVYEAVKNKSYFEKKSLFIELGKEAEKEVRDKRTTAQNIKVNGIMHAVNAGQYFAAMYVALGMRMLVEGDISFEAFSQLNEHLDSATINLLLFSASSGTMNVVVKAMEKQGWLSLAYYKANVNSPIKAMGYKIDGLGSTVGSRAGLLLKSQAQMYISFLVVHAFTQGFEETFTQEKLVELAVVTGMFGAVRVVGTMSMRSLGLALSAHRNAKIARVGASAARLVSSVGRITVPGIIYTLVETSVAMYIVQEYEIIQAKKKIYHSSLKDGLALYGLRAQKGFNASVMNVCHGFDWKRFETVPVGILELMYDSKDQSDRTNNARNLYRQCLLNQYYQSTTALHHVHGFDEIHFEEAHQIYQTGIDHIDQQILGGYGLMQGKVGHHTIVSRRIDKIGQEQFEIYKQKQTQINQEWLAALEDKQSENQTKLEHQMMAGLMTNLTALDSVSGLDLIVKACEKAKEYMECVTGRFNRIRSKHTADIFNAVPDRYKSSSKEQNKDLAEQFYNANYNLVGNQYRYALSLQQFGRMYMHASNGVTDQVSDYLLRLIEINTKQYRMVKKAKQKLASPEILTNAIGLPSYWLNEKSIYGSVMVDLMSQKKKTEADQQFFKKHVRQIQESLPVDALKTKTVAPAYTQEYQTELAYQERYGFLPVVQAYVLPANGLMLSADMKEFVLDQIIDMARLEGVDPRALPEKRIEASKQLGDDAWMQDANWWNVECSEQEQNENVCKDKQYRVLQLFIQNTNALAADRLYLNYAGSVSVPKQFFTH